MKTLKILLDDNISHVSVTTYTSDGIGCLVTDERIEFDIDEKHEICDMTSENLRINKKYEN